MFELTLSGESAQLIYSIFIDIHLYIYASTVRLIGQEASIDGLIFEMQMLDRVVLSASNTPCLAHIDEECIYYGNIVDQSASINCTFRSGSAAPPPSKHQEMKVSYPRQAACL